jgi:predicted dehydrogenase
MAPGRALIVGCGNIGALYDLDDGADADVRTHAHACERLGIPFDVVDPDGERRRRVTARYGGRAFESLNAVSLDGYQIASVCTSTASHAETLRRLLDAGTPLVICEKPVAAELADLADLRERQRHASSVVLVNYMRRFLPAYGRLRQRISAWRTAGVRLVEVVIRYQRGLLNNGGHALDLLELLFERPLGLDTLRVERAVADAFADDPTVSGRFELAGAAVVLQGLPVPPPGLFELELTFADRRVQILDRGDEIRVWTPTGAGAQPELDAAASESGCLANYMLPVFERGMALLAGGGKADTNFEQAVRLNEELLRALEAIRGRP